MDLAHRLDRTIVIEAPRDVVFRYFTDNARWAAWWGAGSTIDARPGGRVLDPLSQRHRGRRRGRRDRRPRPHRLHLRLRERPAGAARRIARHDSARGRARGTRLHLMHEFAEAATRDHHVKGWRYQLSVFANVVADEVQTQRRGNRRRLVRAWAEPDTDGARQRAGRDRSATVPHARSLQLHRKGSTS